MKAANSSWLQESSKKGCFSNSSADARFYWFKSKQRAKKCTKAFDQPPSSAVRSSGVPSTPKLSVILSKSSFSFAGTRGAAFLSVGEGLIVIKRRARSGGSLSRGGSPSAISIAVIPKDQRSTYQCQRKN